MNYCWIDRDEAGHSFAREVNGTVACIFRRKVPSSLEVLMVMDKTIVMGAQADPELPKTWDDAHHKTIGNMYEAGDSFVMVVVGTMACTFRRQVPSGPEALMIIVETIVVDARADPELLKEPLAAGMKLVTATRKKLIGTVLQAEIDRMVQEAEKFRAEDECLVTG